MDPAPIRFDNGAAYEEFMGKWSLLAGDTFLNWLAPPPRWQWADIGCGNGAFTELLVQRCDAAGVQGIDPSEEQLAFARTRLPGRPVQWQRGDAMALPYADASVDAAVMALVIFFVPDPARGVAEMARIVKPGGSVSAYAWDILDGGFPFAAVMDEMTALGAPPLWPPSVEASRTEALRALWAGAGLVQIETRVIEVRRGFADFDTYWSIARSGPRIAPGMAAMPHADAARLKDAVRARLPVGTDGRITCTARANAIKGRVAGHLA